MFFFGDSSIHFLDISYINGSVMLLFQRPLRLDNTEKSTYFSQLSVCVKFYDYAVVTVCGVCVYMLVGSYFFI